MRHEEVFQIGVSFPPVVLPHTCTTLPRMVGEPGKHAVPCCVLLGQVRSNHRILVCAVLVCNCPVTKLVEQGHERLPEIHTATHGMKRGEIR
jgi:hypothetical protein